MGCFFNVSLSLFQHITNNKHLVAFGHVCLGVLCQSIQHVAYSV